MFSQFCISAATLEEGEIWTRKICPNCFLKSWICYQHHKHFHWGKKYIYHKHSLEFEMPIIHFLAPKIFKSKLMIFEHYGTHFYPLKSKLTYKTQKCQWNTWKMIQCGNLRDWCKIWSENSHQFLCFLTFILIIFIFWLWMIPEETIACDNHGWSRKVKILVALGIFVDSIPLFNEILSIIKHQNKLKLCSLSSFQ